MIPWRARAALVRTIRLSHWRLFSTATATHQPKFGLKRVGVTAPDTSEQLSLTAARERVSILVKTNEFQRVLETWRYLLAERADDAVLASSVLQSLWRLHRRRELLDIFYSRFLQLPPSMMLYFWPIKAHLAANELSQAETLFEAAIGTHSKKVDANIAPLCDVLFPSYLRKRNAPLQEILRPVFKLWNRMSEFGLQPSGYMISELLTTLARYERSDRQFVAKQLALTYQWMHVHGAPLKEEHYNTFVRMFVGLEMVEFATKAQSDLSIQGYGVSLNTLLNYLDTAVKNNVKEEALQIVKELLSDSVRLTSFAYARILNALGRLGQYTEMMRVFEKLVTSAPPVKHSFFTYVHVIDAAGFAKDRQMLVKIWKVLNADKHIQEAFGRNKDLEAARVIFKALDKKGVAYNLKACTTFARFHLSHANASVVRESMNFFQAAGLLKSISDRVEISEVPKSEGARSLTTDETDAFSKLLEAIDEFVKMGS